MDSQDVYKLLIAELDAVYRLAYHLVARRQDAEDFVQETYVRAFKVADRFKLQSFGPRPWLFRILHNVISSHFSAKQVETAYLRKRQHDASPSMDGQAGDHADIAGIHWESIDGRLKQALESLSMTGRLTFLLYAVEGLKYREIAEVTEVPIGTVMSRLSRAREELIANLGEYARDQGWQSVSRSAANRPDTIEQKNSRIDLEGVNDPPNETSPQTEARDA